MAIFGWSTGKMPHYTRAANRKRLARDAGQLLVPAQCENKNSRTFESRKRKYWGKIRTIKMNGAQERMEA
jgi:hypothetical protein